MMVRHIRISEDKKLEDFARKAMKHFKENSKGINQIFSLKSPNLLEPGDLFAVPHDSFSTKVLRVDPEFEPRVYHNE